MQISKVYSMLKVERTGVKNLPKQTFANIQL